MDRIEDENLLTIPRDIEINGVRFKIGNSVSVTKTFTDSDVRQFAELSLDFNPIHLDEEAAKNSMFKRRVVHGALVSSLFSGLLGTKLPGEGCIYLGQTLTFKKPVFLDEEVTAIVEVKNIRKDKPIAILRTYCVNHDGSVLVDGEATVHFG